MGGSVQLAAPNCGPWKVGRQARPRLCPVLIYEMLACHLPSASHRRETRSLLLLVVVTAMYGACHRKNSNIYPVSDLFMVVLDIPRDPAAFQAAFTNLHK